MKGLKWLNLLLKNKLAFLFMHAHSRSNFEGFLKNAANFSQHRRVACLRLHTKQPLLHTLKCRFTSGWQRWLNRDFMWNFTHVSRVCVRCDVDSPFHSSPSLTLPLSLSLAACCANFRSHPTWHDEMWKAKNVIFYLLSCRSLSGRKVFQHFNVDFKILSQVFHVFYYLLTQSCGSANNNKIQHTTAPVVVSTIKFHSLSWSGWYFCNKIDEMDNQTSASWEWSSCFSYEHLLNK